MTWEPLRPDGAYRAHRHISCGATGEEGQRVVTHAFDSKIYCGNCGQEWKLSRWARFTNEERAERFEGLLFDPGEVRPSRVVWIDDGTRMYLGEIVGSSLTDQSGELADGRKWKAFS